MEAFFEPVAVMLEPVIAKLRESVNNKFIQMLLFITVTRGIRYFVQKCFFPKKAAPVGKTETVKNMEEWTKYMKENTASKQLVIADFYATWCGPCMRIAPKFAELSEKHTEVLFLKVDTDKCKDIMKAEGVTCMPTFKAYKGGKAVESLQGANLPGIVDMIQKHG